MLLDQDFHVVNFQNYRNLKHSTTLTPAECKLPNILSPFPPVTNFYKLFKVINDYIIFCMKFFSTKMAFGGTKCHKYGITNSMIDWKATNWKQFNPFKPESIINCKEVTNSIVKERYVLFFN